MSDIQVQALIALLVPLILQALKRWPMPKNVTPFIAVLAGVLAGVVNGGGLGSESVEGGFAGLASVGLYEAVKNAKRAASGGSPKDLELAAGRKLLQIIKDAAFAVEAHSDGPTEAQAIVRAARAHLPGLISDASAMPPIRALRDIANKLHHGGAE